MDKRLFQTGALLMALGVGLGAFGAHGLKSILLQNHTEATFKTAVLYHFIHALFILLMAMSSFHDARQKKYITISAVAGIFCFSGSLYAISIWQWTWLGPITPLGGLLFMASWLAAALAART